MKQACEAAGLKFISIVSSNIDEFVMKRIGGLKQQVGAGVTDRTVDGRTPAEQIEECLASTRDLTSRKRSAFETVRKEIRRAGFERVRDHTGSRVAARTLDIYRQLASLGPRS